MSRPTSAEDRFDEALNAALFSFGDMDRPAVVAIASPEYARKGPRASSISPPPERYWSARPLALVEPRLDVGQVEADVATESHLRDRA
jgi:hypothetical protein